MTAVPFDTLKFATRLESAGFSSQQARATAEAFVEATGQELATKTDIKDVMNAIELAKRDLTIRLGAMIGVGIGFLSLIKFFGH